MKRLRYLALAVVILLLGWLVFRSTRSKEPSYQGRTLSQWLNDYRNAYVLDQHVPATVNKREAAEHAIREIGTNAIPFLLTRLQAKDTPIQDRLNLMLDKQNANHFRFEEEWHTRALGWHGFEVLGTNAISAAPRLGLLLQSPVPEQRIYAMFCLFGIDDRKGRLLPIFIKALNDRDRNVASLAGDYLHKSYPEAAEKAGVYNMFPEWKPATTNTTETNAPVVK